MVPVRDGNGPRGGNPGVSDPGGFPTPPLGSSLKLAGHLARHTMGIWIQTGTRLSRLRAGVKRMIGAIFRDASSRDLCPEEPAMREF